MAWDYPFHNMEKSNGGLGHAWTTTVQTLQTKENVKWILRHSLLKGRRVVVTKMNSEMVYVH